MAKSVATARLAVRRFLFGCGAWYWTKSCYATYRNAKRYVRRHTRGPYMERF